MFLHKSKPFAAGLACAAVVMGLAATPAQAGNRSDCVEPECAYPVGGIVQKERDGVNYFYGGSYVESPSLSYIYIKGDTIAQPTDVAIRSSELYTTSFLAPFSKHRFRTWNDHWKWNGHHQHPLELPGLHSSDTYTAP